MSKSWPTSSLDTRANHKKHHVQTRLMKDPSPATVGLGFDVERQKLAREVNTRIGRPLMALKVIMDRVVTSPEKNSQLLDKALTLIGETQTQVCKLYLSLQLTPDKADLRQDLRSLVEGNGKRNRMHCQYVSLEESSAVPVEINQTNIHILEEALTSAALHAGLNEAIVKVRSTGGRITVQIEDQGADFNQPGIMSAPFELTDMGETAPPARGKPAPESAPGADARQLVNSTIGGNGARAYAINPSGPDTLPEETATPAAIQPPGQAAPQPAPSSPTEEPDGSKPSLSVLHCHRSGREGYLQSCRSKRPHSVWRSIIWR